MKQLSWKKAMMLIAVYVCVLSAAFAGSGMKAQAKAKVKLNKKSVTLNVKQSYSLKVKNTKKKVKWTSSDTSIVTVTKKGKLVGKRPGTAVIQAKVGKKKLTCKVTVKQYPVPESIYKYIGGWWTQNSSGGYNAKISRSTMKFYTHSGKYLGKDKISHVKKVGKEYRIYFVDSGEDFWLAWSKDCKDVLEYFWISTDGEVCYSGGQSFMPGKWNE